MKKKSKVKQTEAEKILMQYKDLCLTRIEEREGYQMSLKDAHKRVAKLGKVKAAIKLLSEVDKVIIDHRLQECFPYSQAFFHLKEMLVDRIEEMKKIEEGA
jgi:hypothetical protein